MGERLIDGGDAVLGIDDKEDEVGCLHCNVRLGGDSGAESIVKCGSDTTGINDGAGLLGNVARRGNAIARHPRLIVHDRDTAPCESVKQGGFTDVGSADNSYSWHVLNGEMDDWKMKKCLQVFVVVIELAQAFAEVFDAGPDGEDGGGDGRVDGGEGNDFQHHPAEKYHLGDGADFSTPVGADGHVRVEIVQNPDAANNNDVSKDH